jgi:hypothetical protein
MNPPTVRIGALRAPRGLREARKRYAAEHRAMAAARERSAAYHAAKRAVAADLKSAPEVIDHGFWSRLWR